MKNIQEIAIKLFDLVVPNSKKNIKCESVLLVYPGLIGDTFMFINTLIEYINYYASKNEKLIVIVNSASREVIRAAIPEFENRFTIYSIDEKKMMGDYFYHRRVIKQFQGYKYLKAVYHYSRYIPWGVSIIANVDADEKIYVDGNPSLTRYRTMLFRRCGKKIPINPMITETQKNAEIIRATIDPLYKASSFKLNYKIRNNRFLDNKYILVAVGSSTYKKKWGTENFLQLIQYLLDKYNFDVVITGGKEDTTDWEEVQCLQDKRVHSFIGNTSLKEWISLIQQAELLIGNDSAAIHIAFVANVQAICILGGIDRALVFPYYFDLPCDDDKFAIIVEHNTECVNCSFYGGPKKKNIRCWNNIKQGRQYECLSEISVDKVTKAVDNYFRFNHIVNS